MTPEIVRLAEACSSATALSEYGDYATKGSDADLSAPAWLYHMNDDIP